MHSRTFTRSSPSSVRTRSTDSGQAMNVIHAVILCSVTWLAVKAQQPTTTPASFVDEIFSPSRVKFFLNRLNKTEQDISDTSTIPVDLDRSLPTVIFIHGYAGNHLGAAAQTVKNGFLNTRDMNVILVDYTFYNYPYLRLFKFYKDIGKATAAFINALVQNKRLNLSQLTIVGHSFGAHISAITANNVNGLVERIIGLDPAGPHFHDVSPEDRLSADDAAYVGCIHTSPVLGISESICQVNYYVNGGQDQPSCNNAGENEVLFGMCSHNVPMTYLANSLKNPRNYPASICITTYDAKQDKACSRAAGGFMEFSLEARPYLPGSYYVPAQ